MDPIGWFFKKWGSFSVHHPFISIIASLIIFGCLCIGNLTSRVFEARIEMLWTPGDSKTRDDYDFISKLDNGVEPGETILIATCPEDQMNDCNILTPEKLKYIYDLKEQVYKLEVDPEIRFDKDLRGEFSEKENIKDRYAGTWVYDNSYPDHINKGYKSTCDKRIADQCFVQDPFNFFFDIIPGTKNVTTKSFEDKLNNPNSPIFGKTGTYETKKEVRNLQDADTLLRPKEGLTEQNPTAKYMVLFYGQKDVFSQSERNGRKSLVVEDLDLQILCTLGIDPVLSGAQDKCSKDIKKGYTETEGGVRFFAFMKRSIRDLQEDAAERNIWKPYLAVAIVNIFLCFTLGKRDGVYAMINLAILQMGMITLAIYAGLGLGFFCTLKDSNLNQALFLLILGLGVDGAYVIVNEFWAHTTKNPDMSPEDRLILTCESAGASLLVTTVTDAFGFLIGASTILPGLQAFCIITFICVTFNFILLITAFVPFLWMKEVYGVMQNKYDLMPFTVAKEQHHLNKPRGFFCIPGQPDIGVAFFDWLSPKLELWYVRVIVLIMFAGLAAGGGYGVSQIEVDFHESLFLTHGTYAQLGLNTLQNEFRNGLPTEVYLPEKGNIEYYDENGYNANVDKLIGYLNEQTGPATEEMKKEDRKFLSGKNHLLWPKLFQEYIKLGEVEGLTVSNAILDPNNNYLAIKITNAADYYKLLKYWVHPKTTVTGGSGAFKKLQAAGQFSNQLIFWKDDNNPAKGILYSKMLVTVNYFFTTGSLRKWDLLDGLRKGIAANGGKEHEVFAFAFAFFFFEEGGIIATELGRNLGLAFAVCCVIIMVMIRNFRVALLVLIALALAMLDFVGYYAMWGADINSITCVFILLSLGLAVDHSAHVAHMFNHSYGTASQRATQALIRIGPSVASAVLSTLVAILTLSTTCDYGFKMFFRSLLLINIFGGIHGLLLLPVLLGLLGGSKPEPEKKDEELKKMESLEDGVKPADNEDKFEKPSEDTGSTREEKSVPEGFAVLEEPSVPEPEDTGSTREEKSVPEGSAVPEEPSVPEPEDTGSTREEKSVPEGSAVPEKPSVPEPESPARLE